MNHSNINRSHPHTRQIKELILLIRTNEYCQISKMWGRKCSNTGSLPFNRSRDSIRPNKTAGWYTTVIARQLVDFWLMTNLSDRFHTPVATSNRMQPCNSAKTSSEAVLAIVSFIRMHPSRSCQTILSVSDYIRRWTAGEKRERTSHRARTSYATY